MNQIQQDNNLTFGQWTKIERYFAANPGKMNDPYSAVKSSIKRFCRFTVSEYACKEVQMLGRNRLKRREDTANIT